MGRRGRKLQLAIEDAYWQLIMDRVGTVEAGDGRNEVACPRCGWLRTSTVSVPVAAGAADRGAASLWSGSPRYRSQAWPVTIDGVAGTAAEPSPARHRPLRRRPAHHRAGCQLTRHFGSSSADDHGIGMTSLITLVIWLFE